MTSIAERAHAAAVFIRHTMAVSPHGRWRGEEHARTAVRLAATLGLGLDQITTEPDWLRRRTTPGEPVLATATCPQTAEKYVFLARFPVYDDEAFELLGPCPECAALVPIATIRNLADLGDRLAQGPLRHEECDSETGAPDTFHTDQAHTDTCRYGEAL
ncbi:hypothetical protein [Streptomyces sp. MZ04]|uniref:hypothetical protein n=1 Tax=Streptomyces sp. MZ04 TaxID=2559236 RepID=UPI00107E66AD|nr:hypothetical protein [Streptomyces sp. MZ04]TGB00868.1 hypothetical protein E2651_28200 [Streptomyces sp. MZ04]